MATQVFTGNCVPSSVDRADEPSACERPTVWVWNPHANDSDAWCDFSGQRLDAEALAAEDEAEGQARCPQWCRRSRPMEATSGD